MGEIIREWGRPTAIVVAIAAVCAPDVFAQGGDGYLFSEPKVTIEFESGYAFQRAQSQLFDYAIEDFTIDRRDFDSPYIGGEIAVRLSERWDIALALGFQKSSIDSEYREFIGTDDLPILQTTEFRQIPAVASLKFYPLDRGRSLGRFAWVPRTLSPFVGAGFGIVSYRFEQSGEFIDFETDDIYVDSFITNRQGPLARAAAGVNVTLGKQFLFTAEGRYSWASADVGGGFQSFDRIDLDGLQLVGGLAIRF
jgi:hypothetical protein